MSSTESQLKPNHKIQLGHAAGVLHPANSNSKQGPNTRTASQAESLLAAEKRTLEMIADGASLEDILNDLCWAEARKDWHHEYCKHKRRQTWLLGFWSPPKIHNPKQVLAFLFC